MRKRFMALVTATAIHVGLAVIPSAAVAKTCSGSYVHAVIGGAQKCLIQGEFCSHEYSKQYHRYGFNCVLYASGYYHLRRSG